MTERMVSVPEGALDVLKHCAENEKAHWSLSGETEACVDVPVRDLRAIVAALTAAPVREEGGAELAVALDAWIVEGLRKADQRLAEIKPVGCSGMTPEDVAAGRVSAYQVGFQNGVKSTLTDASFVIMNAALAAREEAPAEVGSLIRELSDAARWRRMPGNENHHATAALFERAVSALRAQPQAREEAQPVAWRMIGKDGSVISLRSDPFHSGFARMMEADVGCSVQPLYTTPPAPGAEKLRAAVEALEVIEQIRSEMVMVPIDSEAANAWANALERAADMAAQALAALQAEQKGGA